MTPALASSAQETPFFVRADGEDVFGILTTPTAPARGVAVIVLCGGAYVGATNRNRVSVRIARRLAARGFHAVRMDYHGMGDSTGEIDIYPLHRPFVDDLLSVVAYTRSQGLDRVLLVGTCFGARTALAAADRIEGLEGVMTLSVPIRDFPFMRDPSTTSTQTYVKRAFSRRTLEGLRDPARRRAYASILATKARVLGRRLGRRRRAAAPPPSDGMSPGFFEPVAALARRGVPVLLGFGDQDAVWTEFRAAKEAPRLRKLLEAPGSRVTVRVVPGTLHGLKRINAQDAMVKMTEDWLDELDRQLAPAA